MRLYFGKYPTQAMLDMHGGVASQHGNVVQVMPIASLAAAGSTGAGSKDAAKLKRPSAGAMATGLIVLLSVVTMLDTTLTWFDRAMGASEMYKVSKFCRDAPGPKEKGAEEYCTRQECRHWAKTNDHEDGFCTTVEWHNNNQSKTQMATCLYYGYTSTPCCGGCFMGQAMSDAKEGGWLAAVQEALGLIADVGTLFFSLMAATAAVTMETTADHFDVTINRSRFNDSLDVTSNFKYTYPAAQNFFDCVYRKHRMPKEGDEDKTVATHHFVDILNHMGTTSATADRGSGAGTETQPLKGGEAMENFDGDDAENMSTAGVSSFKKDAESRDWHEFFQTNQLTEPVGGSWTTKTVIVPVRCLGIVDLEKYPDDVRAERVVAAWSEAPRMQWSNLITPICTAVLLLFVLIVTPESISEEPIVVSGFPENVLGRIATALILAVGIIVSGVVYNYVSMILNGVTHAVIVTDQRLFYIRHQAPCCMLLKFGIGLRVDVFRHDRNITYGRVESQQRSLIQRLMRLTIVPGNVTMQVKFGIIQLTRTQGNVFNVFNVVQQLCSKSTGDFLKKGVDEADIAWDWEKTRKDAWDNLNQISLAGERHYGVCHINAQDTDLMSMGPGLYLVTVKDGATVQDVEEPLFHWSIRVIGGPTSAFGTNQDIVVTTGRVYIWSRSQFKRFNCKTGVLWGACWCGWLQALTSSENMPNTMSFFTLQNLLSFSTNTTVMPPKWEDPINGPLRVPCWDQVCHFLSQLATCTLGREADVDGDGEIGDLDEGWSPFPVRRAPLVQLYMMWRLKTGPQQADLMASVKPFQHQDFDDTSLLTSLNCWKSKANKKKEEAGTVHSRKVTELRAIMGVAQDVSEGMYLPHFHQA